jgi:hypothetical protein
VLFNFGSLFFEESFFQQILHPVTALEGNEENSKQDARVTRTIMAEAAKIAIVAALRTWEGLHLLTDCNSGVRSLIGLLFLSNQLAQVILYLHFLIFRL